MKSISGFILVTQISLFFLLPACAQKNVNETSDFPELTGPYIGQNPPGLTPEIFASDIICTDAPEGCSSFSNDGNLFMFVRSGSNNPGIFIMEQVNGIWTKPQLASFSAGKFDWDFMLAPDDRHVFVSSGRPVKEGGDPLLGGHQIWVSKRNGNKWTNAKLLKYPVNLGVHDSYPSITTDGTLYFFSRRSGGNGDADIYRCKNIYGKYDNVENLGAPINGIYSDLDPFIAPDESYLIFCSDRPGGMGKDDIYITFRTKEDGWTDPVNLGKEINYPYHEYIPSLTLDGKYFFFTTNKTGNLYIYWVSSKIIEELKPERMKD